MNQLHLWDISGPSANCRKIEITVGLPSDDWKFGLAMRGNPSADNKLVVGFPRPLLDTTPYLEMGSTSSGSML
jgi:hypothetical protein